MYCPNCGTNVPNGSRFCVRCGSSMPGMVPVAPQQGKVNTNAAVSIKLQFRPQGNIEIEEINHGLRGREQRIRRGFRLEIMLFDKSNQHTASDGAFTMMIPNMGYARSSTTLALKLRNPKQIITLTDKEWHEASRHISGIESVYFARSNIKVKRNDFQFSGRELVYEYVHQGPPIYASGVGNYVSAHVWFLTTDDKLLYNYDTTSWDR